MMRNVEPQINALKIGTRGSPLALVQARQVACLLPNASIHTITTTGDKILDRPLAECGGKGLFSKEIQQALLREEVDIGVHSLKDMETILPEGLVIGAVLERVDPRDVLITKAGHTLASLPEGSVVGTCAPRRVAHLKQLRPDLRCVSMRGNVQTRLSKLDSGLVDALILARAALDRLDLAIPHTVLSIDEMLPAAGQGVIALECLEKNKSAVSFLNHVPTERCIQAERAVLYHIGGDCHTPISAYAEIIDRQKIHLRAKLFKDDGVAIAEDIGCEPWVLGQQIAERLKS